MKIKVLNLYAGIGGNRKLWPNDKIEVTAVENVPEIAKIYQDFFPMDKVIVTDAHQYLLEHYKEFDFIWSSPPCPTHSVLNCLIKFQLEDHNKKPRYPDMKLYEEIIFLKHWYDGLFVVENVISYYEPLIDCYESGNHYFWSNFMISNKKKVIRNILIRDIKQKEQDRGFKLPDGLTKHFSEKVLNNCVYPELGLYIFNCAFKEKQVTLNGTAQP